MPLVKLCTPAGGFIGNGGLDGDKTAAIAKSLDAAEKQSRAARAASLNSEFRSASTVPRTTREARVQLVSAPVIRGNTVEVRIRERKLDFYINWQFVTSIVDVENFQGGRVGLYTSDEHEVAFDDLEISR